MSIDLTWDTPETQPEEATLDVFSNVGITASLPEETAKKRAVKVQAAFSSDENPPSYEEILNDVQTNREDRITDRLAQADSFRKMKQKQDIIREVVDSGEVTPETTAFLQGLSIEEMADDSNLIEKKYAEWRITMGLVSDDTGTVERAIAEDSEGFNTQVDSSVDRVTRKEIAQASRERAKAKYDETGVFRTATDFVSDALPFFTWGEDMNIFPDNVQATGATPGEYRMSALRDLAAMPMAEYKATIAEMEKRADESGDWGPYLKVMDAIESYTAYSSQVDTAFGLVSFLELAPGGMVFDVAKGLGGAGVRAGSRKAAQAAAREAVAGVPSKGGSLAGTEAAAGAAKAAVEPAPTWDNLTPDYFKDGKKLTLYRGVGKNMGPAGDTAFFTTDPKKAAVYGDVRSIEVDQNDLKHFVTGHGGPDEFVTSNQEILGRFNKPIEPALTPKEEVLSRVSEAAQKQQIRGVDGKTYSIDGDVVPAPPKGAGPHVVEDITNPKTGETVSISVPATDANLARIHAGNTEKIAVSADENDLPNTLASHGSAEEAALAEAKRLYTTPGMEATVKSASEELARKLPSLLDPFGAVVGVAAAKSLYKLVIKNAEKYKAVLARQATVNASLKTALDKMTSIGALRWSDDVFSAVQPAMREQMDKYIGTPSSAILNVKIDYLREWQTGAGRTNQVVYDMGRPDGTFFDNVTQANNFAESFYGLAKGAYGVESRTPGAFTIRVAKYIDETDPNILKHAVQTDTKTPMSWTGSFLPYLRGSAGVSSKTLQENLKVSAHHANALHEAFMVAAKDIGQLSKKEMRNLDALMEAKRDVEKIITDPMTGQEKKIRGEWFTDAADLEKTYKKAFGEFPSDNVTSAYFTMRQMYDFDLMVRNYNLFSEKVRLGYENARLHIPVPDDKDPSQIKWLQQKKGVEVKFLDELPEGNLDILILNSETAQANAINTAKAGREGIKDLQSKGYKLMQIFSPNQRPLKSTKNVHVQFILAKDIERTPLTPNQLPATEGGHVRYSEGFFVKQPKFEITENGERLYVSDQSIIGASSEAEAKQHASNMEIGRKMLFSGDISGLKAHLDNTLPWTIPQFEALFKAKMGPSGEVLEAAALDKDTPIFWVADGQGVNDAVKTHATEHRALFDGVKDTVDDLFNDARQVGKKYTGEKDFALHKIVTGDKGKLWKFDKARMISPMETLEQAWSEISRSIATDDLKIQAMTNWIEEASSALSTPLDELRKNPWEALNNPQWNNQYADVATRRTLDAQRKQIVAFLGQKDQLGSTLDWMRNKLMNYVFEKKGGAAADWVDDHLLPNVRNPLQFARSFAFHTKLGLFNPVQLFLQSQAVVNAWAISGSPARVGSAMSGVTLMQMARVNRTPEILGYLGKKAEKLGWKTGEFEEMDRLFHDLSLHIVEGEVGTLDIMTNPKMFKGVGGAFLDKGLFFFREGERANRMNGWALAYKEYRDKFPTKVLDNADVNKILSRQEVLTGNMSRGSNAWYQKGITGPMTQFWGYQARITEQLLGKQLTGAERLRLGSVMAAMYGMPVSLGALTLFQVPGWSTDDLRQYAMENNIDISSGAASALINGMPAEMIRWMTADENGQNGYLLNIGDRYGPGGLPVLRNLIDAKDGVADAIIDLAFGASGSITRDFFKQVLPDDWDILESATNAPKLGLNDYAGMFSTISTVNNTTKLFWALTTHKNMTKNGVSLGDKDAVSAWITFTTGLDEQRFKDVFLKMDSMKDLKTANDELGKEYVSQIRKAKLLPSGSPERSLRIKKARALLEGMDPKDARKYVKQSISNQGDLDDSVDKSFKQKFKE